MSNDKPRVWEILKYKFSEENGKTKEFIKVIEFETARRLWEASVKRLKAADSTDAVVWANAHSELQDIVNELAPLFDKGDK